MYVCTVGSVKECSVLVSWIGWTDNSVALVIVYYGSVCRYCCGLIALVYVHLVHLHAFYLDVVLTVLCVFSCDFTAPRIAGDIC